MSASLRLNHVSLFVSSLGTSADFYQDVLLPPEIENGTKKPHIRWFGVGGGQSVHLVEGPPTPTSEIVATHFCIATADLDGMVRQLADKGIRYGNLGREPGKLHVRADGIRSVYLQDPDGYWIEVNEDY
jgi:catechol 2,3-dioxygenase-like lactoylglutathione lyase family enzyme